MIDLSHMLESQFISYIDEVDFGFRNVTNLTESNVMQRLREYGPILALSKKKKRLKEMREHHLIIIFS